MVSIQIHGVCNQSINLLLSPATSSQSNRTYKTLCIYSGALNVLVERFAEWLLGPLQKCIMKALLYLIAL